MKERRESDILKSIRTDLHSRCFSAFSITFKENKRLAFDCVGSYSDFPQWFREHVNLRILDYVLTIYSNLEQYHISSLLRATVASEKYFKIFTFLWRLTNLTGITDLRENVTALNMCVLHPFLVEISLTRVRKPQWTKGGPRGVDMKENTDMRGQVTHFDTTMLAGLGQKPLWRWVGRDNDQMALKSWC